MDSFIKEFNPPPRLLMGAGPSNIHPRVLSAMTTSLLGHMDPDFLQVLDDVQSMLRIAFKTSNEVTWPVSATGTGGMEAALVNVLEPGDTILICENGYFANRLGEIALRCGANVYKVQFEPGTAVTPEQVEAEISKHDSVKAIAMVHAETSTGAVSPITPIANIAHDHGALLIVDAVTSFGGIELRIDDWEVDVCYSGTQKCLACPPGLSPITFSPRAMQVLENRNHPTHSFYFDMTQIRSYFQLRAYHHTAPINQIYALREGLRLVIEEGIENRWNRHQVVGKAFQAGIEAMGLGLYVKNPNDRLPNLTSVEVPDTVNASLVRKFLLEERNIEFSSGLGTVAEKVWRVGLMGYNATSSNVFTALSALEDALSNQSFELPVGASLAAARRVFSESN